MDAFYWTPLPLPRQIASTACLLFPFGAAGGLVGAFFWRFFWRRLGTRIDVIFGRPVDLSHLLALRNEPPFDRRPELLYEATAPRVAIPLLPMGSQRAVSSFCGSLHC